MSDTGPVRPPAPRLLNSVREAIRVRHYSYRTEQSYVHWVKRFVLFHGKRHPREMGEAEVAAFLSHLAVGRQVSPSMQNQALCALVFLYREVLERPLGECKVIVRAKRKRRLPVVLSVAEVETLLGALHGVHWLIAGLLYGSGLRLAEALSLRIKDLDFEHRALVVRAGKGGKDRIVTMPDVLHKPLHRHLRARRLIYEADCDAGVAAVWLPYALAPRYPNAALTWGWQFVFAASRPGRDPRDGIIR